MLMIIIGLVLTALLLFVISMQKVYSRVSTKELRRQARSGDEVAKLLYRVVGYGMDVDILLWLLIGLSSSLLFVLISSNLPSVVAFIIVMSILFVAFAWLPKSHTSRYTFRAVRIVTPLVHWILERAQPIISRIKHFVTKHLPVSIHTGLYEKSDIVELIKQQKQQTDNRVDKQELTIVENALQFGDKKVSDVMTPKRMIKMVSTHDMIGPVLMDELHKSGHSRFPVKHDSPDNIVGTLYVRDLISARAGGFVKDIMRKDVFYVNRAQPLNGVLEAFIKTKHHLFLVVNKFEEIVGVISVEDIIEQILGKQIVDEFDAYDDLRAVATKDAEKDEDKHKNAVEDTKSDKKDSLDDKTVVE
ncbi:MAG TPA: CBS domain-containing protein [Candidatus Saccharibacteria bacterium]|nr:CBS domain-containing protein [Candidatus Saccharibacteria bacterium]